MHDTIADTAGVDVAVVPERVLLVVVVIVCMPLLVDKFCCVALAVVFISTVAVVVVVVSLILLATLPFKVEANVNCIILYVEVVVVTEVLLGTHIPE